MTIKRFDFVEDGENTFLVTQQDKGLYCWDFTAWLKGYYDAYIPLSEFTEGELDIIGNLGDNPELLPKECEGYDGEPNVKTIERIWTNKEFNGCAEGSKPCCNNRNMIFSGDLAWCPQHCSCHDNPANLHKATDQTMVGSTHNILPEKESKSEPRKVGL
jgi:hypothetical protein